MKPRQPSSNAGGGGLFPHLQLQYIWLKCEIILCQKVGQRFNQHLAPRHFVNLAFYECPAKAHNVSIFCLL